MNLMYQPLVLSTPVHLLYCIPHRKAVYLLVIQVNLCFFFFLKHNCYSPLKFSDISGQK